jgi:hypothetical protein
MRRHSFIARFGPADKRPTILQSDSVVTSIDFISGDKKLGFGLGAFIDQLRVRGIVPSDPAVDLAVLAALVTAADTRISRKTESQDTWTREIDLYVPVSDPALWMGIERMLCRTLQFLTGDHWRVFFRTRSAGALKPLPPLPKAAPKPAFDSVCLFSGGLDSFIGAIDLLATGAKPLLVSHYWDLSTTSQTLCAQRIEQAYASNEDRHVRARVGFDKNDFKAVSKSEDTQRGRSFLFFALASLAASGLASGTQIFVPENGLISLNVPLDSLRIGAWSTRTTHPFYMARWNDLLSRLNIRTSLNNPYRFKTKGEMLSRCNNAALVRNFAHETISCSSVSKARYQGLSPRHCGYCVPCLIRRASIQASLGNDKTTYLLQSISNTTLDSKRAEGEHVRSFQVLAARLLANPDLARMLVLKPGPLSDYPAKDITEYAAVFLRGVQEVAALIAKTKVRAL